MHIILGILGTIVTILILFNRLKEAGIDIGWLNPFSWYRRFKWSQQANQNIVYSISEPMEAAAALMYTAAKCSGDITKEHKQELLNSFEQEFEISDQEAVELLSSTSFFVKDEDDVCNHLKKFLSPNIEKFSPHQLKETLMLVEKIISVEDQASEKQQKFLQNLGKIFLTREQQINKQW